MDDAEVHHFEIVWYAQLFEDDHDLPVELSELVGQHHGRVDCDRSKSWAGIIASPWIWPAAMGIDVNWLDVRHSGSGSLFECKRTQ